MSVLVRIADPQMFPAPIELLKLQSHGRPFGLQYGPAPDGSFGRVPEVIRQAPLFQLHTLPTGLSWSGRGELPEHQ